VFLIHMGQATVGSGNAIDAEGKMPPGPCTALPAIWEVGAGSESISVSRNTPHAPLVLRAVRSLSGPSGSRRRERREIQRAKYKQHEVVTEDHAWPLANWRHSCNQTCASGRLLAFRRHENQSLPPHRRCRHPTGYRSQRSQSLFL
jgi:hypothetical protein